MDDGVDALIDRLTALSDRERVEFARWAADQSAAPAVALAPGRRHVRRVAAERAAARAFDVLRRDGTLDVAPWDWATVPGPDTWSGREAAVDTVRAMAAALAVDDGAALSRLRPAFARLGLRSLVGADRPRGR